MVKVSLSQFNYMRLYHFLNAKYALDDIKKKRIKISLIPDLNDPFELWTINLPNPEHRRLWKSTVEELSKSFGVICLSRKWNNPLLWSHYADKHFGICLGFDVNDQLIKEINYRKSKLPVCLDLKKPKGGLNQEQMQEILYTKFSDWGYEDEVRVVVKLSTPEINSEDPSKSLYFSDFSSQFNLKEVIVGVRSDVSKVQIENALQDAKYSNVQILKARLAFKSFRVVPNLSGFSS
ncbi:MAG: DUF2971 domain-containing protein [Methylophilus sp.]|nr:DUF2971 domain-containing protein [Methylophilus sp.]